jgi:hypothetical protein
MTDEKMPQKIRFLGAECDMRDGVYVGTAHGSVGFEVVVGDDLNVSATIIMGGHKLKNVVRSTMRECEEATQKELIKIHHDLTVTGIVASAPSSIADALLRFLSQWSRLPPLVRAGFADAMAQDARRNLRRDREVAFFHKNISLLPRRQTVREWFGVAEVATIDLFLCLAGQADAEAAARGIDADIAGDAGPYDPKPPTSEQMMVSLETAVMQSMGEKVREEIDAEIVKATDRRDRINRVGAFRDELRALVNRFSMENASNTPDDVLADLLVGVLDTYAKTVSERDRRSGK